MRLAFYCYLMCFAVVRVGNSEPEPVITQEMALQALTLFRDADPFSKDALGSAAVLVRFAEKDSKVRMVISRKALPFISSGLPQQQTSVLLGAFVAGNLHSQLLSGKGQDDPYAGDLQVIQTYRAMQKKKPKLRISEIERLIALEERGELKAYLAKEK